VASAFQPTPRARLRRALGLAAALATLGLGAAPAVSAPVAGLLTVTTEPDQPAPAPTPPEAELRPADPPLVLLSLLPEPAPAPAPTPAPAPALVELVPLLPSTVDTVDDGVSLLSHLTGGSSTAASDGASTTGAAGTPQGTGSASPEPTTGAAAPDDGASGQGPGAVSPAAPTPSGTATAATLMPVIDAVSRPIGPARRSREIAPTGTGGRSGGAVRVSVLGRVRHAASAGAGSPAAPRATGRPAPALAHPPTVHHGSPAGDTPHAAAKRVIRAVADAGRSPWLPVVLLLAIVAYVLGQRLMDGGAKLSHAGHGDEPDDELIEL
jgi:hypothetical protein